PAPPGGFDFVTPLLAVGAALLLLGVSFGFSEAVRLVTGRKSPRSAPPPETTSSSSGGDGGGTVISWKAAPDPGPKRPAADLPAGPGVRVNGGARSASGDGLFFVDAPLRGTAFAPELHEKEPAEVPVHDLAAGKPLGTLRKEAPRGKESLLSPDGRSLVAYKEE